MKTGRICVWHKCRQEAWGEYRIQSPQGSADDVWLCDEHREGLEKYMALVKVKPVRLTVRGIEQVIEYLPRED